MGSVFIDRYYDFLDKKYRNGLMEWDKVYRLSQKLMEWDLNNK
jgi:hypothetical protein